MSLAELTRQLVPPRHRTDEETVSAVLGGRVVRETEIGNDEVALIARAVPLRPRGQHTGALILVRDVSDLRRRDRELVTKDATIREIHHRVKNNLQTVAALLRLQGRRIESPEAREALEEAVRRVGSIAVVHETLSESAEEQVNFDEIADRLIRMVVDFHALGTRVQISRSGSFGVVRSAGATALSMILTEIVQNAVEHGYPDEGHDRGGDQEKGSIVIAPTRLPGQLHVSVNDDGVGLPEGFSLEGSQHLGLSIVRTLVESELAGQISVDTGLSGKGTCVSIVVPLD